MNYYVPSESDTRSGFSSSQAGTLDSIPSYWLGNPVTGRVTQLLAGSHAIAQRLSATTVNATPARPTGVPNCDPGWFYQTTRHTYSCYLVANVSDASWVFNHPGLQIQPSSSHLPARQR